MVFSQLVCGRPPPPRPLHEGSLAPRLNVFSARNALQGMSIHSGPAPSRSLAWMLALFTRSATAPPDLNVGKLRARVRRR